ncbi:hypothetical protein HETIRDRAFT_388921 [Heterobasidion irregulare TC 32-1]|uniref:F-box domain-containing protein n=1 Tax=Heterobasidion irregulare (strain TC 32-1) TaxID=747525 RepID=W4JWY9_HETIT|nr:uncharacterized protein HETIRDRAFT_388921 [Heterobasidion irregulare TC 32-1]ETW77386.1 hypothetical protein HETIRDRAFT_388921 [Heterobasidion irregulare TC 32-1]
MDSTLRLPTEIIAKIFVHCLPRLFDATDELASFKLRNAPTLLTTVCKRWRDIALDTPQLWSNIYIGTPQEAFTSSAKQTLGSWLARSAHFPLTITIYAMGIGDYIEACFDMLVAHAHRWACVIVLDATVALNLLSRHPDRQQSILSRFLFEQCVKDIKPSEIDSLSDLLCHAPRLREVVMRFTSTQWTLPWTNLTHLSLRPYHPASIPDTVDMLSRCSNLTSLHLNFADSRIDLVWDTKDAVFPPLVMHHLQFLMIKTHVRGVCQLLLDAFEFRELQHLLIHVLIDFRRSEIFVPPPWPALRRVLSHSTHSMEIFDLHLFDWKCDDDLADILATLPNLTSISTCLVSDVLMDRLTLKFSPDGRLISGQNLKLRELEIGQKYNDDIWKDDGVNPEASHTNFVDMAESRVSLPANAVDADGGAITRLRTLRFGGKKMEVMESEAPAECARMRALEDQGLSFVVMPHDRLLSLH